MKITTAILVLMLSSDLMFGQIEQRKIYTTTPTYHEIINIYEDLSARSNMMQLQTYGITDAGFPLHLMVINRKREFDPVKVHESSSAVFLINNGIHPGEPDGIDACIELMRYFLADTSRIPKDVVICIIPVYNVGGCLNRSPFSRANQNGPEQYGFRGNAKNLDLNRDFIKADSENMKAFSKIFHTWKPVVFSDNHVSNGADYQYVMTLISTQRDKFNPVMSKYMTDEMLPQLYSKMKERKYEMSPYVDSRGKTPETGLTEFLETPRYSTGYTALFNCIGFVPETHMWKPYNDRVWATYELMLSMCEVLQKDGKKILELKRKADEHFAAIKTYSINWDLDTTRSEEISFKGFESGIKKSELTGHDRLYYDRSKPFTKKIKYYAHYKASEQVKIPYAYVLPQAWKEVADRLLMNGVKMYRLSKDTILSVSADYILSHETVKNAYEGHYLHYNIQTRSENQVLEFRKGDWVIISDQPGNAYIVETLESKNCDSFFAWGFFDGILMQKEWFSDYVFEEKAIEILDRNLALKTEFEEKKKSDKSFADSHMAQLYFVYKNSPYYERSHNRVPVYKIAEKSLIPLLK